MTVRSLTRAALVLASLILAAAVALACSNGPQREDCQPGYLKVHGQCTLAVGQDCNSGGECLSGICVAITSPAQTFCTIDCQTHTDCPVGFYCTLGADNRCYPGKRPPPCTVDSNCQPCQQCQNSTCQVVAGCVTCQKDANCAPCERCQQNVCITVAGCKRCLSDDACAVCESCASDNTCQYRTGCVLCASDTDCPGCFSCDRGACSAIPGCGQDPCFNDSTCPQRTRCLADTDTGFNVCLPVGLPFGADCHRGGNATCQGGVCLKASDGTLSCSRPCTQIFDCPSSFQCLPDNDCLWACRRPDSPPPGSSCQNNGDCQAGRICSIQPNSTGTSWEARCFPPLPCAGEPGQECNATQGRCTTGICTQDGFCSPVCSADSDCPVGFLCDQLQLPLPNGGPPSPFFGCAPADKVLGEVGEACPRGDAQCKSGLCLKSPPGGPHPYCSKTCTQGGVDCPDRFECRESPVTPGSFLCQPAVLVGECRHDSDCQNAQVCTLTGSVSGSTCIPPIVGGAAAGSPCGGQTPCADALCIPQGFCGALCLDVSDCPATFICDYFEVYLNQGQRATVRMCAPDPGSMLRCQHDADCQSGEVCSVLLNPWGTGLDGRCQPAGGGAGAGSPCTHSQDCQNDFCPVGGECTSLCTGPTDCATDFACTNMRVSLWSGASFPVTGCIKVVPGNLGDPCPNGAVECVSGICFHPSVGTPYCSQECQNDQDCAAVSGMTCPNDGAVWYCQRPNP